MSKSKQKINKNTSYTFKQWLYPLVLIILTTFVYSFMLGNELINWDDHGYINESPYLKNINLKHMFSNYWMANYHPLTMLIYALEYPLFGMNSFGYHFVSLLFHLANVLLVFYFILLLTGKKQIVAFLVALLFAIHPMHVESVAWASELKDVLYTFFFLAALLLYIKYIQSSYHIKFLFYSLLLFVLSLFSKGQAVVLSPVLFLVDYYVGRKIDKKAIIEKIPFFILSLIFGIIAIYAQESKEALSSSNVTKIDSLFWGNYGLFLYLIDFIFPIKLCGIHPYPFNDGFVLPIFAYIAPFITIGLILFIILNKKIKQEKSILFGFFFFLITVSIVLKFMPVSDALIAERYTYIPYIGLFFIVASIIQHFIEKGISSNQKMYLFLIVGFYCFMLMYVSITRMSSWKNSFSFWNDVVLKYPEYWRGYASRADAYNKTKQYSQAVEDYTRAVELSEKIPGNVMYESFYLSRAAIYAEQFKQSDLAIKDYNTILSKKPSSKDAYQNKGIIYYRMNNYDSAIFTFSRAIQYFPSNAYLYYLRALCFGNTTNKEYEKAIADLTVAIKINETPTITADAYLQRGVIYVDYLNIPDKGISDFKKSIEFNPSNINCNINLGVAYYKKLDVDNAIFYYSKAIQQNSALVHVYYLRSLAYAAKKDYKNALSDGIYAKQNGYQISDDLLTEWKSKMK